MSVEQHAFMYSLGEAVQVRKPALGPPVGKAHRGGRAEVWPESGKAVQLMIGEAIVEGGIETVSSLVKGEAKVKTMMAKSQTALGYLSL